MSQLQQTETGSGCTAAERDASPTVCVYQTQIWAESVLAVALLPPSGAAPLSSSLLLWVNTAVKLVSGWMFRSVQYVTWKKVAVTLQAEMQP